MGSFCYILLSALARYRKRGADTPDHLLHELRYRLRNDRVPPSVSPEYVEIREPEAHGDTPENHRRVLPASLR